MKKTLIKGYIALHRETLDNEVVSKNSTAFHLWIYCLLKANFIKKTFYLGRERVTCKRGSFITSYKHIADDLGIARATVHYWLNIFKVEQMIERKATSKYTIISIKNYNKYQRVEHLVVHGKNAGRTLAERSLDTTNKDNKDNKDNKKQENTPKKLNPLIIGRGQTMAFLKEFPGLTTSELKEQKVKCNNYMAMSSVVYTNPGLFFKGWLKKYMADEKRKKAETKPISDLPVMSEKQIEANLKKLSKIKSKLKMKED